MFGDKRPLHDVALRVITRSLVVNGNYRTKDPSLRYTWGTRTEGGDMLNTRLLYDATSTAFDGTAPVTSAVAAVTHEHVIAALVLDPEAAQATADDFTSDAAVATPVTVRAGVLDITGTALLDRNPFPADGADPFHDQFLYPVTDASVQVRGEATAVPVALVLVHQSGLELLHAR
jgi:hypothetical protein